MGVLDVSGELSLFERGLVQLALSNDRHQRADAEFFVVWYGNGGRRVRQLLLHDDMTSALADLFETMFPKDRADLAARKRAHQAAAT